MKTFSCILIIDNYDSFTYNIVQNIGSFSKNILVRRNNEITLNDIKQLKLSHIIISPGPGNPHDAGISNDVIRSFAGKIPLLGICLGHQCIAHAFGGRVIHAPMPIHGKTAEIYHDRKTIYTGLKNPFIATRYHSLIVQRETLPGSLEVSAQTADGLIMGLRHKKYALEGVQFHPESILTTAGTQLLRNFLKLT